MAAALLRHGQGPHRRASSTAREIRTTATSVRRLSGASELSETTQRRRTCPGSKQSLMATQGRRQGQGNGAQHDDHRSRTRASTTTSTGPTSTRSSRSSPARRDRRDPRRLRGQDQVRDRQAHRDPELPLPQPAERPDLRQGRREGRLPRRPHPARSSRAARSRSAPPA